MRHFGNFLAAQATNLRLDLFENYKKNNPRPSDENMTVEYITDRVEYYSGLRKMSLDELVEHAKQVGVKIPCPSNY